VSAQLPSLQLPPELVPWRIVYDVGHELTDRLACEPPGERVRLARFAIRDAQSALSRAPGEQAIATRVLLSSLLACCEDASK
jgi:hypothetical protein